MKQAAAFVGLLSRAALLCFPAVAQSVGNGGPPASADLLAGNIRTALQHRDLGILENLVFWEGASAFKRRLVLFEMRKGFGRPIRSVTVEPFTADNAATLAAFGAFKPNMDVKFRIHVVFDEPATQFGHAPDMMFLVGQSGQVFKIALVNPLTPTAHQ